MGDSRTQPGNDHARPKRTRATAREFTTAEKLRAVSAALATNIDHPTSEDAMRAAAASIGTHEISRSLMSRWLREYRSEVVSLVPQPTNAEIVTTTFNETLAKWERVRDKALTRLYEDDVINKAAARDLAVIAGISDDHIEKATAIPSEIQFVVREIMQECMLLGYSDREALEGFLSTLREARHARATITITATASNDARSDAPQRDETRTDDTIATQTPFTPSPSI